MARNLANPDEHEPMANGDDTVVAQNASPAGTSSQAGSDNAGSGTSSATPGGGQLATADDCAVTDQQTTLRLPVLDNDQAQGRDLEIIALSQPESGSATLAEDGSIRFSPDAAGLQQINYVVDDGAGGIADGKANIFVNPDGGQIEQPVLEGLSREEMVDVARSCVDGGALDIVRLAGDQVLVAAPAAGQRIQVAPKGDTELGQGDRLDLPPDTRHSATVGPSGVTCMEAART
jgi:hypothetical protein